MMPAGSTTERVLQENRIEIEDGYFPTSSA